MTISVLAACGAAASAAALISSSSSSQAKTGSAQLLSYKASGGLAGRTASLTVSRARRVAAHPNGRTLTLSVQEFGRLRAALIRADLARLPARSRPPTRAADGYLYIIAAGGQRVVTETGAVPRRLAPLLSRLNGLLRRAGVS
jgi:hypothetical protein